MILTDAGPLVALADARDTRRLDCQFALRRLVPPMVTVMPAFAEAMYLLGRRSGWRAQQALWQRLTTGTLQLGELDAPDLARARELMLQYSDLPMDFADATVVAYAERHNLREIFTLDRRDFSVYRLRGRTRFAIFP